MGKRARKFNSYKGGDKKVKNQWTSPIIPNDNPIFKAYYELQLGLPQQQFEVFWATMKQKLPVVFRINPSCPNFTAFRAKIQDPGFLQSMVEPIQGAVGGQKQWLEPKQAPKLQILPWYPDQVLYQINTTKQIFKKSQILNNLHKFLQKAFDAGLVARQELVSMLPPLFLDIKPEDIVLDMCAAPGSKTSQILQMLYGAERGLTTGCVIANDADYSRAQMLIHQINRSGTAGMAVINHPGQFLPQLYSHKINHLKQKFQFDKVLCDVPCSGDGATRKIPLKWAKWHTADGIALHPLQLSILMKSVNLLKRGGLIVYSTCSLNPIENEAVLAGLLKKVARGLQIVDIHSMYEIKGRRGLFDWKVCGVQTLEQTKQGEQKPTKTKKIKVIENFESAKQNIRLKESMFPPSLQQAKKMQLNHSMRMLPHDHNSGGFFVALLKKHLDFEWRYDIKNKKQGEEADREEDFVDNNQPQVENPVFDQNEGQKQEENENEEEIEDQEECQEVKPEKMEEQLPVESKKQEEPANNNNKQKRNDPHYKGKKPKDSLKYEKFSNMNIEEFQSIRHFFGLDQKLQSLLYVRDLQGTSKRNVLLISEGVRRFLDADIEGKIKLVNMGCKVFQKGKESFSGHECLYRLSQQGIHFLLPYMKNRKIKVTHQFFRSVISIHSLVHQQIKDVKVRDQMREMSQGSFCIYIDEEVNGRRIVDAVVGQNFKSSFHLMVGKEELASLNLRYL